MEVLPNHVGISVRALPICTDDGSSFVEDPSGVCSGADGFFSIPHLGHLAGCNMVSVSAQAYWTDQ